MARVGWSGAAATAVGGPGRPDDVMDSTDDPSTATDHRVASSAPFLVSTTRLSAAAQATSTILVSTGATSRSAVGAKPELMAPMYNI